MIALRRRSSGSALRYLVCLSVNRRWLPAVPAHRLVTAGAVCGFLTALAYMMIPGTHDPVTDRFAGMVKLIIMAGVVTALPIVLLLGGRTNRQRV